MLLCGGDQGVPNSPSLMNDTWELSFADGDVWVPVTPLGQAPAPRSSHGAVYDSKRDRMIVLWGLSYNGGRIDCEELDLASGPTWRPFAPPSPSATSRANFGAVYDPTRDQAFILGGSDPNYLDTWEPTSLIADFSANPITTPPPLSGPPLALLGFLPNPTPDVESIAFDLPVDAAVHARIFDASGRLVRDLGSKPYVAGRHLLVWDGKNQRGERPTSGVYFARLSILGHEFSGKFVFLR
jgi:hypothetical protein